MAQMPVYDLRGPAGRLEALLDEPGLPAGTPPRAAVVFAFARAGDTGRLAALAKTETDPTVRAALERATRGESGSTSFRTLAAVS